MAGTYYIMAVKPSAHLVQGVVLGERDTDTNTYTYLVLVCKMAKAAWVWTMQDFEACCLLV